MTNHYFSLVQEYHLQVVLEEALGSSLTSHTIQVRIGTAGIESLQEILKKLKED